MATIERRITQIGNSLGLTLPNETLKAMNVKKGDEVQVELVGNQLIIKKAPTMIQLPDGVPADFFNLLEEEMEAHHEALKGLVDR
ncbi:AbrB/MazE/SpoVT family DNA-binding domain-containing protein [Planococcus sp. ISL-110]|uniref:AbrB/MazE/SpoVT family DNA-binding domain-containing protein n=1 Tax=Planococcus sp. ISL-110 TaxID=2819167 RepID=UPI001BEBAF44|nr:AbrB/MazE/SpoVT family DNA-binding domain-containing protein [Planococcus sp. ISL-110]MBT2572034.1 AbrB/MazE/SpoVT family DNA-binding domain-containing protein [Planococcus sp. ISL-110]